MDDNKLTIAVCDDEAFIRESIEQNIRHLYPDTNIIKFDNGNALIAYGGQLDIIFLDIQMDGISGMEAARQLRAHESSAEIIFITAMEEYVYEAFDVRAFNYILKPFEKVKFFEVLQKAVAARREMPCAKAEDEAAIRIKTGGVTRKVFLCDILCFEVFGRKVLLHVVSGEEIEFYGKLSRLEGQLPDSFFRCHRSYIVNLKYVLKYTGDSIILDDARAVPLAKQRHGELVKRYLNYIESTGRTGTDTKR